MKRLNTFLIVTMLCLLCANADTIKGDLNGDNSVDIGDMDILINIILGKDKDKDSHEYVDLGLPGGVLWATCNIGAEKPEDYGLYFAWGDTTGYNKGEHHFGMYNYVWENGKGFTKYNSLRTWGVVDNKFVLDPEDDAAQAKWGSMWRMPSYQELQDLFNPNYTTKEMLTINGVYGAKITSLSNGNSIFIPATGYCGYDPYDYNLDQYWDIGIHSYLWSRDLQEIRIAYFGGSYSYGGTLRYYGLNIRAVRVKTD